MDAFSLLCRTEGIIPAIESAHALAGALQVAGNSARARCCWSTCPAGVTRTSISRARWFGHLNPGLAG